MQQGACVLILFLLIAINGSCKKGKAREIADCSGDATTVRTISDKPAVVKVTGTVDAVYLVEEGSIDTKLIPCNLPMEFLQNDLQVVISGEVKLTNQRASGPCCSENFEITKITR